MAKFNDYYVQADNDVGKLILQTKVRALSLEAAWHKAVSEAFEAVEPGTGDTPHAIVVERLKNPSESHG